MRCRQDDVDAHSELQEPVCCRRPAAARAQLTHASGDTCACKRDTRARG
jgi:hypothetical protein